ncbi:MAG: CCA tRNA nucleotidyltransferase, partial [Acidobacteria bacterium]|nr:CCA tRNA nucleotidyltransferase [Acidobacteriota bacterium]
PVPLLSGKDLIESGRPPGPQFRTVLQAVEDAQLEGTLRTREEAMSFVETNFPKGE